MSDVSEKVFTGGAEERAIERNMAMRIGALRRASGIGQGQLAERLGASVEEVVAWESGDATITASRLLRIANELECSIVDLYGDDVAEEDPGLAIAACEGLVMMRQFLRVASEREKEAVRIVIEGLIR